MRTKVECQAKQRLMSKWDNRLFNHIAMWLYDNAPEVADTSKFSWYYTDPCGGVLDDLALTINSLHGESDLPWPNHKCVTFVPMDGMMYAVIHAKSVDIKDIAQRWGEESGDGMTVVMAGSAKGQNDRSAIEVFCSHAVMLQRPMTEEIAKHWQESPWRVNPIAGPLIRSLPCVASLCWYACFYPIEEDGSCPKKDKSTFDPLSASTLLMSLANQVAPCHYRVKTRMRGVFGTKPQRRHYAGREMISLISYERLHSMCAEVGERHVKPHDRRGHYVHRWKDAGIDRRTLPKSPIDRYRLYLAHNVERYYRNPTWVGPRHLEDQAFGYEIEK